MNFCDKSIVLYSFMYIKYIIIGFFIVTLLFKLFRSNKNIKINKLSNILLFIIVIYYILFLIFFFTNIGIKDCFINSNIFKIKEYILLEKSYKKETNVSTTNSSITTMIPREIKQNIGSIDMSIFDQNQFPMSNYEFSLNNLNQGYLFSKSGTEIATLSSAITSLTSERVSPIEIIDLLNTKEMIQVPINMDELLNILVEQYDFLYSPIVPENIDSSVKNGGIVLAKVHGSSDNNIFTCSDSYIIIYDLTGDSYSVMSVNDKNHDTICSSKSKGFGNYVEGNINDKLYSYEDITYNTDNYYVLWR